MHAQRVRTVHQIFGAGVTVMPPLDPSMERRKHDLIQRAATLIPDRPSGEVEHHIRW